MAEAEKGTAGGATKTIFANEEFAGLLQKEFRPKSDTARSAVEQAVKTLAEQALAINPHQSTALGLLGMVAFEEQRTVSYLNVAYCTLAVVRGMCPGQCGAVRCSAVQCSVVHCSAVQCTADQCDAVQCSVVQPQSESQPRSYCHP